MKRLSLIALFILNATAEPSVFGAGDLSSDNPYGLSQSEKVIVKNRDDIAVLNRDMNLLKIDVNNLKESIDGLKSVIEGQNSTFLNLKGDISKVKSDVSEEVISKDSKIEDIEKRLNDALSRVESVFNRQNEDINETFNSLRGAINTISTTINKVYGNYVSKDELNNHLKDEFKRFSKDILTEIENSFKNSSNSTKNDSFKSKDNQSIYKEAKELYLKKEYKEAETRFKHLIENNYLPATSHFYIGEINYYTKDYKEAIFYYKKSAELYDKASYMPTLLLHIAISFENINDIDNAKIFYSALIDSFQNSNEAKLAEKNLNKLQKR
jgi:TolA-binding protein